MNIENILNKATKILTANNVKNPSLDSQILLSQSIKKNRAYVILNSQEILKREDQEKFNNLIERRKKGEPIAHITNKKEFWKNTFYIDKNVLIPRPDTEIIVEHVLKIYPSQASHNILDIGIGSGCILLSILMERPRFTGTGVDISKKSLNVCKYNAKKLSLIDRIKLYNSDVDNFEIGKYDIIVSNPPYIELLDLNKLDNEIYNFEPKLALSGGYDGFSEIKKVVNKASKLIKKNGKFFLEIGFNQKEKVKVMLKEKGFYVNEVLKDYGHNYRCIISTKI